MTDATYFAFVDDESGARIQSLCTALSRPERQFSVEHVAPGEFEALLDSLRRGGRELYGLLLDHRLDDAPSGLGRPVRYRGFTLAQEIRTRSIDSAETGQWDYPISLLSMGGKIDKSYTPDPTSHDLFDTVYRKEEVSSSSDRIGHELMALAAGYKVLRDIKGAAGHAGALQVMLGSTVKDRFLDRRVVAALEVRDQPCHYFAHFILRDLLGRPGPLIDLSYLAARLGVDAERSTDWLALIQKLDGFKFNGVFSGAWERWWWPAVEQWWRSVVVPKGRPPAMLDAESRVEALKTATQLSNLVAAAPILPEYRSRFWTICAITGRPLDCVDGVRISEAEPLPWQEPRYMSVVEAVNGGHVGVTVHPVDVDRVARLQEGRE